MLRVALDARTLQHRPRGGVGRALAGMLPHIRKSVDVRLLLDARDREPHGVDATAVRLPGPPIGRGPAWLQTAVPPWLLRHRRDVDLFHGPFNALPFARPVPMVVTIHDLSFEDHPEWFRSRTTALSFRVHARGAARSARRVVTVSEWMRVRLVTTYGLDPDKIVVARNAVDGAFAPPDPDRVAVVREEVGLDDPYVVALGGPHRRRPGSAIEAWRLATRDLAHPPTLVVIGPERPRVEGVVGAGPFEDWRWPTLLAGAEAFIYPTLSESFGMPALEAAASGTPVVCSRVGALPEVLGDAAEWVDGTEVGAYADGLRRLLRDPAEHERVRQAGLAVAAAAPGWEAAAEAHVRAYTDALA